MDRAHQYLGGPGGLMANWGRNREGEAAENAHFWLGCHLLSTGTGATTDCMALEQTH